MRMHMRVRMRLHMSMRMSTSMSMRMAIGMRLNLSMSMDMTLLLVLCTVYFAADCVAAAALPQTRGSAFSEITRLLALQAGLHATHEKKS